MNKVVERQAVVFSDTTDADLITFVSDELESAVQIFHVRGGRIHGQRGWVVERGDNSDASLLGEFITQFYGEEAELTEQRKQPLVAHRLPRWILNSPRQSTRRRLRSWVIW